jgi:hypothetical protein
MKKEVHTSNYDWLAVTCFFKPYSFTDAAGNGQVGCQMLFAAAVMEDGLRGLTGMPALPIAPGTIDASSLIQFLDGVFELHGRPVAGVMVMAEVWMGTSDLLLMPALADRTQFLVDTGESWGETPSPERETLGRHLRELGLDLEWSTSDRPSLN